MQIRFSKQFRKQYQRLPKPLQQTTRRRLELWQEDPMNSLLRVHRLSGRLQHLYSLSVTGDLRVLYELIGDEIVIFQMVGTHAQLYG
ncbi:type II toxin-antitoxin system YafQ family toxin [Pseudoclavibacter soli]|uniref:type II toxin-antitoxin system RelE/ParE family toxin n=1 Tax=Pseudoclavibacter soli TaxID=452623 RepID=UPI0004150359|nr:type II toxin-antitoxin system mRNA interferase toxin, RelE/StbE family [Pseudoclavibacter soli]